MSGKFMKVKRIMLPMLTVVMISSQLCGCAAANSSELLNMLNTQQSVTIEVAEPISVEQGTEKKYEWVELASLTTYQSLRDKADDLMKITPFGAGGKNGVIYTDLAGNHTNNSTLYYAFSNEKFVDEVWNNTDTIKELIEATKLNYVDIESDAQAKLGFINAYFNILPDHEYNYFNGSQTLTRAEFMGAVYRAANPVQNIVASEQFGSLVDPSGSNEQTDFANQVADYSYLGTADKSLNEKTFNGTITRAEAVYMLVKMYYNAEYESLTGKETAYSDTKNAGNMIEKVAKKVENGSNSLEGKSFVKSYELSHMLSNASNGMSEDLYKAMVIAKQHGIIVSKESRWDEGLTKAEALDLIINVYLDQDTKVAVDRGQANGAQVVQSGAEKIDGQAEAESNEQAAGTVEAVDEFSCLDGRIHITRNEDGTFNYTDEYIGAIAMYNYFGGMTEDEIKEELNQSLAYVLIALDGQKTDLYISGLIRLKDIIPQSTPVESNTGASDNGSNVTGNGGNNNPGNNGKDSSGNDNNVPSQNNAGTNELITDPDYEFNPSSNIWDNVITDKTGEGGEFIDPGDAWNIQ